MAVTADVKRRVIRKVNYLGQSATLHKLRHKPKFLLHDKRAMIADNILVRFTELQEADLLEIFALLLRGHVWDSLYCDFLTLVLKGFCQKHSTKATAYEIVFALLQVQTKPIKLYPFPA